MQSLTFWAEHEHWPTIHLEVGDITTYSQDAIVTGVRPDFVLSGGVNTAVHRVAGTELGQAVAQFGSCPLGQAVISQGFKLPAKYVIHTACPAYNANQDEQCRQVLSQCYDSSLGLSLQHQLTSLTFPSLATGVFGFPHETSASLAARAIRNFLLEPSRYNSSLKDVYFLVYHEDEFELYKEKFGEVFV